MAHVSFTGNTTKDPEVRIVGDKTVLNVTVAENHSKFNKQTNQYEDTGTTFRRVALWGKTAEHLADKMGQGSMIHVSGRESTSTWTTQEGEERTTLEVDADNIGLIYPKPLGGQGGPQQRPQQGQQQNWNGQGGFQQQAPRQPQPRRQQAQADPWNQQGSGNYQWNESQQESAPY